MFYSQYPIKVKICDCFYCGDAAGRDKDFSNSDYCFALNIGIPFTIPEDILNNTLTTLNMPAHYDFQKLDPSLPSLPNLSKGKHLVIMCGPMASGKTTLSQHLKSELGDKIEVAHLDIQKTKAKMLKFCNQV